MPWYEDELKRLRQQQNPRKYPSKDKEDQPVVRIDISDTPVQLPEDDKPNQPNRGVEIVKILKNKK